MKSYEKTVNEIMRVNDLLRLQLSERIPKTIFKQSTTLDMAKDIVLNQSSKKADVYDHIEEIFEENAPVETPKKADMVLGEIARLFWK